jgi:nucleoside-diphosphate-sugar epimerase
MRVVITGASGNVGTSLLHALAGEDRVDSIVGIARRRPAMQWPKTSWVEADITRDALEPIFRGADCVVHLAWAIQPSRDEAALYATNVEGSQHVFGATARAGVPALVYASSVGAYSTGPKDRRVDESWPTHGIPTSFYSRHKAATERLLDSLQGEHPELRVVRMRPGLIFKREAATGIRRLFAGPFLPNVLVRRALIPFVPKIDRLRFQAVHSLDVGEAYRLAIVRDDARGAYNVAAEPVLDPDELGRLLGARPVPVPPGAVRAAADLAWRLRLQPTPKGWVDMALGVPIMSTDRIRDQLKWRETRSSGEALLELLAGMRDGSGADTPPLSPRTSGPLRAREMLTGVGRR